MKPHLQNAIRRLHPSSSRNPVQTHPALPLLAPVLSAALLIFLGTGSAPATVFTGDNPGNVVALIESSPLSGIYSFSEDYLWRDEEPPAGAPHPETLLGSWASRTVEYHAEQWDGIGNTIMLESDPMFIEYHFSIPVDAADLVSLSINTVMRGVGVRSFAYNYTTNSWPEVWFFLTQGQESFSAADSLIGSENWDTSIPGQVGFRILIDQISGSGAGQGIDSLTLTATTVPEPHAALLLALGLGSCAWAVRRNRR